MSISLYAIFIIFIGVYYESGTSQIPIEALKKLALYMILV